MMRLLVDAQLPPALARWLAAQGYRADHVADHQLAASTDTEIWNFATEIGAAIITKDEDFMRRKIMNDGGPTVIWIRLGNSRRRDLFTWFEKILPDLVTAIDRGETLIEVI